MFVIQIADVTDILSVYSCKNTVVEINMLAYYQELDKECIIIAAVTDLGEKYVLKMLSEESVDIDLEEQRSSFSEFLRNGGLPVPKKYTTNGKFCYIKKFDNTNLMITVEDYFGNDVKDISGKSAYELGRLLGIMHNLSYESNYHLKIGSAYTALKSGSTAFKNIWGEYSNYIFNDSTVDILSKLHNQKMINVKKIWEKLPIAAVHGDLALTCNFMLQNNKYGIIDFNLAGDEPLLGDLLLTWYSSRYSDLFIRTVPYNAVATIREKYFSGYYSVHSLSNIEKNFFDELSQALNGVYFNRFVSNLAKKGEIDLGKELSRYIFEQYYNSDSTIDIKSKLKL